MALYRNIAGIPDNNRQVGLSMLQPTTYATLQPAGCGFTFADLQAAQAAAAQEKIDRYDWLMSHSYNEITAAGYYVTPDNGSIFQWIDKSTGYSKAWLALQDFQQIENERGTAGALLLHMQEPALAKDTAGYEGGGSGTWYGDTDTDPTTNKVSDPIPAVQGLPPVTSTDGGGVQFADPGYNPPTTTTTTTTPTTSTPLPVDVSTALKNNFLPLAVMASVVAVALIGDSLPRRKLIVAGGVGTLFYLMAKKQ